VKTIITKKFNKKEKPWFMKAVDEIAMGKNPWKSALYIMCLIGVMMAIVSFFVFGMVWLVEISLIFLIPILIIIFYLICVFVIYIYDQNIRWRG